MQYYFIDVGNSFVKVAAMADGRWKLVYRDNIQNEARFYSWLAEHRNAKLVVCSVIKRISGEIRKRVPESGLTILDHNHIPDQLFDYDSPDSLGMDRFFSCYGAWTLTEDNVVVIDAGSACTIDYMNEESVFCGGVIMPGHRLLIRSVSKELPELPEPEGGIPVTWPGKSTIDCLGWGTTGVFLFSISAFLEKYRHTFGDFKLFLTGGDTGILENHITDYPVQTNPFLIFEGMNAFRKRYLGD
jgi:type III pantothenate kinase